MMRLQRRNSVRQYPALDGQAGQPISAHWSLRFGRTDNVNYLDGLRGFAAMQVVGLHFVSGFMPVFAEHAPLPLRLLFDGHTAVYVFFLISGAVLTPSLSRPGAFLDKISRRVVRLGIPTAAAAVIALLMIATSPAAHIRAAALSGSNWLAMDSSGARTLSHLVREIGLDSLLVGYRETTLFTPLASRLPLMQDSLDAPFWSLHLELYGSLLVLILVTARRASAAWHAVACGGAALLLGAHPMSLFVAGHLAAPLFRRRRSGALAPAGAALLLLGAAMCATKDWRTVDAFRLACSGIGVFAVPDLYQFQSQLGAVALFFGVLLCPAIWALLESAPLQYLGRLSFGIYLVHFPILFSLVCAVFIPLWRVVQPDIAIAVAFAVFVVATLFAAEWFERLVDVPAVRLSHLVRRPISRGAGPDD